MRFLGFILLFIFVFTAYQEGYARTIRIVAFGDSLTYGAGLNEIDSFPVQLETLLKQVGYDVEVINEGINGNTSADGKRRVQDVLMHRPDIVILALGANDMLRKMDIDVMTGNLEYMIELFSNAHMQVVFAGLKAPHNYGLIYAGKFNRSFRKLAERHDVVFFPDLLKGVAGDPRYNLSDGIHPNAQGAALIANNIMPYIEEAIDQINFDSF